MNTTHNHKKFVASVMGAAAAVAAPALLFLGAGIAQAIPTQSITWDPWVPGIGLTAHITNYTNVDHMCTYTATPDPNQLLQGLPTYTSPQFDLPAHGTYNQVITDYELPIPATATGTKWNVTLDCGPGDVTHWQHTY